MSTTIRMARAPPFSKSDALREDVALAQESAQLANWLAARSLDLVTMNQVLTFVRADHPAATLQRSTVYYHLVWDPVESAWFIACVDRGVIAYELDDDSPAVEIQIEIAARY